MNVDGTRSHKIVADGITILRNLVHRGAVGGDLRTGDGAGILLQNPHRFFARECARLGIALPEEGGYGVAMLFLPLDENRRLSARSLIERTLTQESANLLGWREVPVQPDCLGALARNSMPNVAQAFLSVRGPAATRLNGSCIC